MIFSWKYKIFEHQNSPGGYLRSNFFFHLLVNDDNKKQFSFKKVSIHEYPKTHFFTKGEGGLKLAYLASIVQ